MKKIILSLLVCSSVLFGCKSGGDQPKDVLNKFFEALSKNDITTARTYATEDSKSMLDMMEMGMKMSPEAKKENDKFSPANMEYGDPKIEGDKATVSVKEKTSGETMNYTLKKEKGGWKVAFDKSSMMQTGMDKMKEKGVDVNDSISKGLDELKNVNTDSIAGAVNDAMKSMDSTKH